MLKKSKVMSLICAGLVLGSTFMPMAPVYADEEITHDMDIDVNYDPFTDGPVKKAEDESKKQEPLTFSQRMALKHKDEAMKIANSSVLPGHLYIPKKTPLNVELMDNADCKKMKKYQSVRFKTIENLIINDVVVIPANTVGNGYVFEVQRPGAFGRKGVLRIAAKDIKTINGVNVPLMKGLEGQGRTDRGAVAVAAAVSLIGGIFMKGSGVSYDAGQRFVVEVRDDTDLQCTPDTIAEVMDPAKPRGQAIYVPVK